MGHKHSLYSSTGDWLLCEVKQPLALEPGDGLDPARSRLARIGNRIRFNR